MILNHCVAVLDKGCSQFYQQDYTPADQVMFKLLSGVTAQRLDSIKTALLMIEVLHVKSQDIGMEEQSEKVNNLLNYFFEHFSEPGAMALVQYAIRDRKIPVRNITKTTRWSDVSALFKPVIIDKTKDAATVRKYIMFERNYEKLKGYNELSDKLHSVVIEECQGGTTECRHEEQSMH